jgi:hypothetical protein
MRWPRSALKLTATRPLCRRLRRHTKDRLRGITRRHSLVQSAPAESDGCERSSGALRRGRRHRRRPEPSRRKFRCLLYVLPESRQSEDQPCGLARQRGEAAHRRGELRRALSAALAARKKPGAALEGRCFRWPGRRLRHRPIQASSAVAAPRTVVAPAAPGLAGPRR